LIPDPEEAVDRKIVTALMARQEISVPTVMNQTPATPPIAVIDTNPLDTFSFTVDDNSLFSPSIASVHPLFNRWDDDFEMIDDKSIDTAAFYYDHLMNTEMFDKDSSDLSPLESTNHSTPSSHELNNASHRFYKSSNEFFTIALHANPTTARIYPTHRALQNHETNSSSNKDMAELFSAIFHSNWQNTHLHAHAQQDPLLLLSLSSLTGRKIDEEYWNSVILKTYEHERTSISFKTDTNNNEIITCETLEQDDNDKTITLHRRCATYDHFENIWMINTQTKGIDIALANIKRNIC
jgi:hypothetical protein